MTGADLATPWAGADARRMLPRGFLSIAPGQPGAIKQALNASGWLDDEVVAAGELRQGRAPSLLGMVTGTALIEVARPRRTKLLPRRFVLAATADRPPGCDEPGGAERHRDEPHAGDQDREDDPVRLVVGLHACERFPEQRGF